MAKINIISGIQLSNNPRVVKEADALTEAGHQVEIFSSHRETPGNSSSRNGLFEGQKLDAYSLYSITQSNQRSGNELRWIWSHVCAAATWNRNLRRLRLGKCAATRLRWHLKCWKLCAVDSKADSEHRA